MLSGGGWGGGRGGGVTLYIGMCGPKENGFSVVLVIKGYLFWPFWS